MVDDVGPSRRDPLRACCRFWTANLLMSESGTSTGPLPLFCHLTSPDSTVRGPHRGVAPLLLTLGSQSPAARVHPDLLCPCFCHHPRLCTLSLQSPLRPLCAMDSAQLSLQGTFFTSHCQPPRGACSQNIPWLHRHHRYTLANHVGGHHSPYRNGDRSGAVGSITLDPSNLIL